MALEKRPGEFQIDFPSTETVIDTARVGKKGYPMHYAALGLEPPTKIVPVEDGMPQTEHPGLTLAEYAAAKRWEKENGGITVGGAQIATDDRSKVMISGARVAAENDPNFSTEWKSADGSFLTVNAAMVIAISDAMLAHVSNCFAIEAQVLTDIESGLITTPQEVDTAFA